MNTKPLPTANDTKARSALIQRELQEISACFGAACRNAASAVNAFNHALQKLLAADPK